MNIKKTIAGISALSVLISSGAFSALTASAADTADYKTGKITAHLYALDKTTDIECRYYNDMPNVPYIRYTDYYKCWVDQELKIKNNNDGTYEITVPSGATGIIDVNKETLKTDDVIRFSYPEYLLDSATSQLNTYVANETDVSTAIASEINFSENNLDLRGSEDDVWWPVATICDTYDIAVNQASFVDNEIYFCSSMTDLEYSRYSLLTDTAHGEAFIEKYKNGRPKDLIEYNYNELCFIFDHNYGFPGRIKYNDLLAETDFDTMLSTANESTKKIREMLLSEDVYEYCAGFYLLNNYFWDGGHTGFVNAPLKENDENKKLINDKSEAFGPLEGAIDWLADNDDASISNDLAKAAREKMIETADTFEELKAAKYFTKGDTAVFSFDSFSDDSVSWIYYYYLNGEMPDDLISEFNTCVNKANNDPKIKNFVIDLSTNTGGLLSVTQYIMGMISNRDNITLADTQSEPQKVNYYTDKNLDKAYDEKDAEIKFDLNFGVITSKRSFSCGNLLPSLAKDNGVMLVGETSGGGSCAVYCYGTPDGMFYTISTGTKFVSDEGKSIDMGITPNYELVKKNEDGTKDYSEVFNFDTLSKLFVEFYKSSNEEQPSTTPAATTSTTTSSTTTTTTTTTTSTTTSSSTSSSSASSSSTTIPTTTADKTSDLPQTGNNSTGKAAAAACAFVFVVSGGALILISRKHRKEDNAAL